MYIVYLQSTQHVQRPISNNPSGMFSSVSDLYFSVDCATTRKRKKTITKMLVSKGRGLGFLHGMFQQIILGLDIHKMLLWSCEASFYLVESIRIFDHWFEMVLTLHQTTMHTDSKSVWKPLCQCFASSTGCVCVCVCVSSVSLSVCLTLITAFSKYVSLITAFSKYV